MLNILRERPPVAPKMPETTYIEKIIPPPSPPPRQVVVERIPAPEKPRDVIYEVINKKKNEYILNNFISFERQFEVIEKKRR